MRRALITHNDLDGLGSAVLVYLGDLNFDDVYVWQYGIYDRKLIESYDEVIVTDLSFAPEQVPVNMTIFDHHESSKWLMYDPSSKHQWNDKSCGTELFYNKFWIKQRTPIINQFVELVRVYDIWQSDDKRFAQATDLNRFFQGMIEPIGNKNNTKVISNKRLVNGPFMHFIQSMAKTLKSQATTFSFDKNQQKVIDEMVKIENKAYQAALKTLQVYGTIAVCEVTGPYASFVCNKILDTRKDVKIAVAKYPRADYCSLRSHDVDMSEFQGFKEIGRAHV